MNDNLAITYISTLLVLLAGATFFVIRQVIRTRGTESTLSRLQRMISEGEATAETYYDLAGIYLDKNMFAQAVRELQRALKQEKKMNPEQRSVIYNALGYGYVGQEQYDLAIRQYKEAVKLSPDYVTAWNNLGFAYERKQLEQQALEAYEQALAIDPKNASAERRAKSLRKRFIPTTTSS
jgi:tetratricopeptide (TPR) repeat protein